MSTNTASEKLQLPPTTWEQRKPFYAGIEDLLNPGFFTHAVTVGGVSLSLRSPSPGDLFLLRNRVGRHPTEEDWMLWSLSTCTWMLDGALLLEDVNFPVQLIRLYRSLPLSARKVLYSTLLALFDKMERVSHGVFSFFLEERSRHLWVQLGGENPTSEKVTGVPGTSHLGMNLVQRMWVAFNQIEDRRIADANLGQWSKFVASASNPKGVKQVTSQEKMHLEEERVRRQEERDTFYYMCIGVLRNDDTFMDGSALQKKSKSAQDLQKEFQQWVTGEKDVHDTIVDNYKRSLMERYVAEQQRLAERAHLDTSDVYHQEEEVAQTPLTGYSAEMLAELMQERGQSVAVRRVYDGKKEAARAYVFDAFLNKPEMPPPPGGFVVRDGKIVTPESSVSLDEKIRNRDLRYGLDPSSSES